MLVSPTDFQTRKFGDEAEEIFDRADRGGAEAGRAGLPVADLVRQLGVSEQTFYRWKRTYGALESEQVRELKQVVEENARLRSSWRS